MARIVPFNELPDYPEITPHRKMLEVVRRDGLIEPLLVMPDGNIYEYDREKFQAFKQACMELGEAGNTTAIVCYYEDLDDDEKSEYSWEN